MLTQTGERIALLRYSRLAEDAAHRACQTPTYESIRHRSIEARERVLADLATYLKQFEANAIQRGAQVLWAESAQDANRAVVEAMRKVGAGKGLRNHAPIIHELSLVKAAKANGINLVALHGGEHLLDLNRDSPSHPVYPAAHLRTVDASAILDRVWKVPTTLDPDLLASHIRARLRRSLLEPFTAVVGVQFAVAETGGMACLDNDGHNASLTAMARHLICLAGIDQIVATQTDLHDLVESYSRSAWGRSTPAYLTGIQDPAAPGIDGPRSITIILIDNGRSRIRNSPVASALRCIHCGACHNTCPIYPYTATSAHRPAAYNGPIGSIINPLIMRPDLGADQPFLSTDCGDCATVCPVGIDLPELLHRQRIRLSDTASWQRRFTSWWWQRVITHQRLFVLSLRIAQRLKTLGDRA